MKRILIVLLVLLTLASASACSKIIKSPRAESKKNAAAETQTTVAQQSWETAAETEATEETATEPATETAPGPRIGVSGVIFSVPSLQLNVGESYLLTAHVLPENATNKTVYYTVSNDSVISYNDGLLTAKAPGAATVTATTDEDGYIARCAVTVVGNEPSTPTEPQPTTTETPVSTTEPPPTTTETPIPTTEPLPTTTETPIPTTEPLPTTTETPIPTTEPPYDPLAYQHYEYDFAVDLSAYEQYMDPVGEEYLILVDADHPLPKSYVPADLVGCVNTRQDGRDTQKMRLYAAMAMEALYKEAEEAGMLYTNYVEGHSGKILSLTTAYRSYGDQAYLFESYVERETEAHPDWTEEEVVALVKTYSCPPGTSEHQTGLCTDMHNWPTAGRYMAAEFSASPAGKWLQENCYKFGFILRFPEDKTDVTGITYEPWHFRYVGRFHATRMHELNMCLEEYLDYLTQYGYVINEGLL